MAIFYEKGRYRVRFVDQALGKASTGTPQFVLKFMVLARVVGPDHLEDVTQYERTAYFYITDKTVEWLTSDLEALGFRGESFRQLDPSHPDFHDFRDQEADMWCGEGKNLSGEPKEQWGVARASSQLDVAPLDSKEIRQLDNLFGKHLKKGNGNGAPAQTSSAPRHQSTGVRPPAPQPNLQPAPGIDDSDIPF